MNNAVFGKTIKNVRKHRDIKLVAIERRRKYLILEPNYHTTKFFTEKLLAVKIRETQILMNKSIIYKDIAEDIKTRFDVLNFELDRPLPK